MQMNVHVIEIYSEQPPVTRKGEVISLDQVFAVGCLSAGSGTGWWCPAAPPGGWPQRTASPPGRRQGRGASVLKAAVGTWSASRRRSDHRQPGSLWWAGRRDRWQVCGWRSCPLGGACCCWVSWQPGRCGPRWSVCEDKHGFLQSAASPSRSKCNQVRLKLGVKTAQEETQFRTPENGPL